MPSRSSRALIVAGALGFLQALPWMSGFAQPSPGFAGTYTMAVGGVTSSSARFRVHTSTPDTVNVEVSTDTVSAPSIFGTPVKAESQKANTVLIDVKGLRADQQYFYRTWIGGVRQARWQRFNTFPEEGTASRFSVAFGSCQQSGSLLPSASQGKVFHEVARSGASLFLQLGDWGYPDSVDDLPANNNFFAGDYGLVQASYLTKFGSNYPMNDVLSIMPVDYVYDDHDFMNNNASATTSSYFDVTGAGATILEIPNPVGARENSIRGYKENMPTYPLANESRGIYHSFTFGNAEFFMLDLRSQRSPNMEVFRKNPSSGKWEYRVPEGHSIMAMPTAPGSGPSELAWLLDGLKSSKAKWKFLVSSVPFNKAQALAISLGILLQDSVANNIPGIPPGTPALFAALEFSDKWVGFPADIDTILNTIRRNGISNVIVLSGDSHTAAMDDGANAGLPEIMAGGLDIENSKMVAGLAQFGFNIWNRGGQGLTTSLFNNAFGKVTVFGADSVLLQLIDEEGTVFASHTISDPPSSVGDGGEVPTGFALEQNYPNPFNPTTRIKYTVGGTGVLGLGTGDTGAGSGPFRMDASGTGQESRSGGPENQRPGASNIRLIVYDVLGREVAVLVDEKKAPGSYEVQFSASGGNGRQLASGVYVCRLTTGSYVASRKMVLIR
jgi:phosphodiesterase/alkaline phosphatase D-like protein